MLADGKIYIAEVNSTFPRPEAARDDLHRASAPPTSRPKGGVPVTIFSTTGVLHGRVYFMNQRRLLLLRQAGPAAARTRCRRSRRRRRRQPARSPPLISGRPGRRGCSHRARSADLKAYAFDAHGPAAGSGQGGFQAGADAPAGLPARHHAAAAAARLADAVWSQGQAKARRAARKPS